MSTSAADLSPEDCYARAIDHLSAGRTERAIKLLQVAALKAPHDNRYREALREARGLLAEQAQELSVDPEVLYTEAQALLAEGKDTDKALKFLKIARARAPGEPRYREALAALQQARQPAPPPAKPSPPPETAGERLSRQAAEDVDRTDTATGAASSGRVMASRRTILIPLLLILVVSVGISAVSLWLHSAHSVPVAPYQAVLPAAARAQAVGEPLRNELILTVSRADWAAMSPADRDLAARGVLSRARQDDFMVVYIYDADQRLLATAHPERIYFPE